MKQTNNYTTTIVIHLDSAVWAALLVEALLKLTP